MTNKEGASSGSSQGSNGGNLPAVQEDSQKTFGAARDKLVQDVTALAEKADDETAKKALMGLAKAMNPRKKGREEMQTTWTVPVIRIVHGVTKERPDGAEVGDLYTTTGYVLKQPFKIAPVYPYQQNLMFGDRDSDESSCVAPDAQYGRPFGKCELCVHYPRELNAAKQKTACNNVLCFFVLSHDLKLYRVEFSKTSHRAGQKLHGYADAGDDYSERWLNLKTQLQTYAGNEWHIFRVSATTEETPEYVRQAADLLYDLIRTQRNLLLAQHYAALEQGQEAAEVAQESVNIDELEKAGGDNPDLSGGPI